MIDEPTEGTGGRLQSMATATKTKALRIATRCVTVEQFIATFHRFCDETSFFISTLGTRPIGLETAFSIQLEGGKPVLQGLGVVLDAWTTTANRFNRPGVRLGLKRLTNDSVPDGRQLLWEVLDGPLTFTPDGLGGISAVRIAGIAFARVRR